MGQKWRNWDSGLVIWGESEKNLEKLQNFQKNACKKRSGHYNKGSYKSSFLPISWFW